MPAVAQYNFSLQEVTEALIKQQDLHEGLWSATFNLNVGVGLMGPKPGEIFPSAMVQITSVALSKVDPGQSPPPPGVVDAAVFNPAK